MIGLRLTFTAGRYHATGWDHHVNEGVAEWPPAPWRILRALVAASYRLDAHEREHVPELVERLTALPVYRLPSASTAHLRHYMPIRDGTVKVLDTFVAVGDGARNPADVLVWWPSIELTSDQRALLGRLSEQIGYLGRAESWVEVAVEDAVEVQPNACPLTVDGPTGGETVRLLAAQSPDELAAWRERWAKAAGEGTKAKKGKASGAALPASVWDVLNVDTGELQRERWSQAPGSCWVEYQLGEQPRVRPRPRHGATRVPKGVVFLLESAVRPTIEQTLVVAERMRSAVMGPKKMRTEPAHWQFSGKDENERPLEGHEHAYFLPLAHRDREGREVIDRLLIWARRGFEVEAWTALQRLAASGRKLRGQADDHPLDLILAGYGDFDELRALLPVDPERPREGSWLGPSKTWVSATPFVPPRFTKIRAGKVIGDAETQLRWLIRDVLEREDVELEPYRMKPRADENEEHERESAFGWNRFVRVRKKDRARLAGRQGWGFRITFAEEVTGPIALGYGAHFGLGMFRPER